MTQALKKDTGEPVAVPEKASKTAGKTTDLASNLDTLRAMLDGMPINVMTCDKDTLEINYINQTSIDTLRGLEHLLPVKADEIKGTCIDIFHKDPSHQRRILSNPANLPHTAIIEVGEELLDLLVTAIYDKAGNYVGPMLTWAVVTEKVRTEKRAERLINMIDDMPIAVMTCDPETLEIDYLNRTSINALKGLQQFLPVPVENLVGTCIDIFHENPSHQRTLLGNPDNLPHKARIEVGPETLALNVAAIRDNQGAYIGPMVTWDVVTEQIKMATQVSEVVEIVSNASTELQSTATSMSSTAEETSKQATAVAGAAEQTATNVQTVAAAAEELAQSVQEIARQMAEADTIAKGAVDQANKTNETIDGLSEAAQKIGQVVNLINDIASQTNLLALNATIEAARAGEAGKGFAVVASEVKSLANQTAKATEEIASQVNAMQTTTGEAVVAIGEISSTIDSISEITTNVAGAAEEQQAATQEIGRNIQEAATGTQEVSSTLVGVETASNETGASANQVLEASKELSGQAEHLKQVVDQFLAVDD